MCFYDNKKDAQRPYDHFRGGIAPRSLLCVRKQMISFFIKYLIFDEYESWVMGVPPSLFFNEYEVWVVGGYFHEKRETNTNTSMSHMPDYISLRNPQGNITDVLLSRWSGHSPYLISYLISLRPGTKPITDITFSNRYISWIGLSVYISVYLFISF